VTITQSGSAFLEIKGNYTFQIQVNPACIPWLTNQPNSHYFQQDWPAEVRTQSWPVAVKVDSYISGVTYGVITNLPGVGRGVSQPEPSIMVSPTGSTITFEDAIQGPRTSVIDYAFWLYGSGGADGPTRASDGRGEILKGILPEMSVSRNLLSPSCPWGCWDNEWHCGYDRESTWSLRAR
jgi:hypothetical protein